MNDNLKNQQTTTRPTDEKITAPLRKLAYSSPVLRVYGAVADLTQGASTVASDGTTKLSSDPRGKENIARIGTHPLGIGLYLFDYLPERREQWGHGRQFGVMADEVEAVMPSAVSVGADGYKMVDYGMLGIRHFVH